MKKVLIIEDEENISSMYKLKFEISGYQPLVAEDGEKGLELARKEKPDLILLDIMLPKINGFEVLRLIKEDENIKNIKVYILSNLGQDKEVEESFKRGADGFMIKANLTPSQLISNVKQIFEGKTVGIKRPQDKAASL